MPAVGASAGAFGTGGKTGVEILTDEASRSKDVLLRSEVEDGIGRIVRVSFLLLDTSALNGRRPLLSTDLLRPGSAGGGLLMISSRISGTGGAFNDDGSCCLAGDGSFSDIPLSLVSFVGDGEREEEDVEIHDFRANVASLPDIERTREGRTTGSGGFVSGTGSVAASSILTPVAPFNSSADSVNWDTAILGRPFAVR